MAGQRYLIDMADVLRAAGLSVVEVDGWQTRARKSGGYDGTYPWCVMWHHTASKASPENDVAYIISGSDVAPVSNLYLARDGTVHVCAAGATNTNGSGGPLMMSCGVVPVDDMNRAAVSVEMANDGVGERWPQVQIDAMFRTSLALTNWLGLQPDDVAGHYDWTPGRKIDPARADAVEGPWQPRSINTSGTWAIDDIRDELWRRYEQPEPVPEPPTPEPKDDDMPITFVAAAPNCATVLVAMDGAGISLLGFASEDDQNQLIAAAGNPPVIHISVAQMGELTGRAAAGETS